MPITLSHHDIQVTRVLASVSGSLSCFGSALLILSYCLFSELRTHSSRLILALSISDLGEALAWALAPASDNNEFSCYLEAIGVQFFGVSSVLWQMCISTYVVQVCLGRKHLEKQEKFYHLICWGIPTILVVVSGAQDYFGNSGAWCWIKHPHELPGLFLLYVPFVVSVPYCILIYTYVHIALRRKDKSEMNPAERIELQRIRQKLRSRLYPS